MITRCLRMRAILVLFFFFSSRRRHTRFDCDWSSDVCSSDLPENLFLAYQRSGGDRRYRDFAVRFLEQDYFDPLAEDNNVLPGEHAYSHVNEIGRASCRERV